MQTFKKFHKQRANKFSWAADDVEHHKVDESLVEFTHDKPTKFKKSYRPSTEPKPITPERDSFVKHHQSLDKVHREATKAYKRGSRGLNHYLRHQKIQGNFPNAESERQYKQNFHDHVAKMDHVTSHKIEHHHTVFRGGVPKDETHFPVGHEYTDHGYTGTSFHEGIAKSFDDHKSETKKGKEIVHVIHVPPGTKGHYLDVSGDMPLSNEHELLLRRGTRFKVTHHTSNKDTHYIHSRVVSQKTPRKLPDLNK